MACAVMALLAAGAGLAGFHLVGSSEPAVAEHQTEAAAPVPPVVTEIPGAGPMPQWLMEAAPAVQAEYHWAAAHHEELQHIPCYCGCDQIDHGSDADCFFQWQEDGTIAAYERHASGCGICVEISSRVRADLERGVPLRNIRAQIDETYGAKGLPATETPQPPAT